MEEGSISPDRLKCQAVGVWNGGIQTLVRVDAIFILTRGVGAI